MTDTLRALDEAIQAHIAEAFENSMTLSWVVVTQAQDLETPGSNYRILTPEGQQYHVTQGLVTVGNRCLDDVWLDDDDDD